MNNLCIEELKINDIENVDKLCDMIKNELYLDLSKLYSLELFDEDGGNIEYKLCDCHSQDFFIKIYYNKFGNRNLTCMLESNTANMYRCVSYTPSIIGINDLIIDLNLTLKYRLKTEFSV